MTRLLSVLVMGHEGTALVLIAERTRERADE